MIYRTGLILVLLLLPLTATLNYNNSTVMTSTLLVDIYSIELNEMYVDGLVGTDKSDNVTHTLNYNGVPVEINSRRATRP